MTIGSNGCENPMYATNQEDINNLLSDGYEVGDDRLPSSDNKPIARVDTDLPVYK